MKRFSNRIASALNSLLVFLALVMASGGQELAAQGGTVRSDMTYYDNYYVRNDQASTLYYTFNVANDYATSISTSCSVTGVSGANCFIAPDYFNTYNDNQASWTPAGPYAERRVTYEVNFPSGGSGTATLTVTATYTGGNTSSAYDTELTTYAPPYRLEVTPNPVSYSAARGTKDFPVRFFVRNTGAEPAPYTGDCLVGTSDACAASIQGTLNIPYLGGYENVLVDLPLSGDSVTVGLYVLHGSAATADTAWATVHLTGTEWTTQIQGPDAYVRERGGDLDLSYLVDVDTIAYLRCETTSGIGTCSVNPTSVDGSEQIDPFTAHLDVSTSVTTGTTGKFILIAEPSPNAGPLSGGADTVSVTVHDFTPTVAGTPESPMFAGGAGQTVPYTITAPNLSFDAEYDITADRDGTTLTQNQGSVVVPGGESGTVLLNIPSDPTTGNKTITVRATLKGGIATGTDSDVITVNSPKLTVSAVTTPITVAAGSTSQTASFSVLSDVGAPVTFEVDCGRLVGCSEPTGVTLVADVAQPINVTFAAPQSGGLESEIKLTALNPTLGDDSAVVEVVVSPDLLTFEGYGPRDHLDRSQCLNLATGQVALQCDDVVMVVPLPGMQTLGQERGLNLIYNSALASGQTRVGIGLTPKGSVPDSYELKLLINRGTTTETAETYTVSASGLTLNQTYRMVMADRAIRETDLYEVIVEAREINGGVPGSPTTVYDTIPIINWEDNDLGPGWSHSANERLYGPNSSFDNKILWVGPDGSYEVYRETSTSDVWEPSRSYQKDKIIKQGSTYARVTFVGSDTIFFSSDGLPTSFSSPGGPTTSVGHSGGQISSVSFPVHSGQVTGYTFDYSGGVVYRIRRRHPTSPGSLYSDVTLSHTGGNLTSLTLPGALTTSMTYTDGALLATVQHPRGRLTTISYAQGVGQRLRIPASVTDSATVNGGDTKHYTYTGHVAQGWQYAVAEPVVVLDGPRSGTIETWPGSGVYYAQTNEFWLNEAWGVERIRDPESWQTFVYYEDPAHPRLPTGTFNPIGDSLSTTYDELGRVESTTLSSTGATTTYQWDPNWNRVSRITDESLATQGFMYDGNGDLLKRQFGASGGVDPAKDVTYTWDRGRLLTAQEPGSATTTYTYDTSLGNVKEVKDALGETLFTSLQNQIGQDTLRTNYLNDSGQFSETRMEYDTLGRPTLQATESSDSIGVLSVTTTYNSAGDRWKVTRATTGTTNALTLVTERGYDGFGRVDWEKDEKGHTEYFDYDAAGNTTSRTNRRGDDVTMTYDARDLVVSRTVGSKTFVESGWANHVDSMDVLPAACDTACVFPYFPTNTSVNTSLVLTGGTEKFRYDRMGRLTYAENWDGKVTREYNTDGTMSFEKVEIRGWKPGDGVGSETTLDDWVEYRTDFGYDALGRLKSIEYPDTIANVADSVSYTYHPAFGTLQTLRDRDGSVYTWQYDDRQRMDLISGPNGTVNDPNYDKVGRVTWRNFNGSINGFGYDIAGRRTSVTGAGVANESYTYNGFGHMLTSSYTRADGYGGGGVTSESFTMGPLGMVIERVVDPAAGRTTEEGYSYDQWGRLESTSLAQQSGQSGDPSGAFPRSMEQRMDADGNVIAQGVQQSTTNDAGNVIETMNTAIRNYYDPMGQLRVRQRYYRIEGDFSLYDRGSFEEFRYGPLGRRLAVRFRADDVGPTAPSGATSAGASTPMILDMGDGEDVATRTSSITGLEGNAKMTWAFWIKSIGQSRKIGGLHGGSDPNRIWWFEADNSGSQLRVVLFNESANDPGFHNFPGLNTSATEPQFVVVQFDGSQSTQANRLRVWIDGVEKTRDSGNSFGAAVPTEIATGNGGAQLYWGGLYGQSSSSYWGELGELIILDNVLTSGEMDIWEANGINFDHDDIVSGYRWQDDTNDVMGTNNLTQSWVGGVYADADYPTGGDAGGSASGGDGICQDQYNAACLNSATYFVWSGDQILMEEKVRTDNRTGTNEHYGVVAYTHAGGIDQPFTVWTKHEGTTPVCGLQPSFNHRGLFRGGVPAGAVTLCNVPNPPGNWRKLFLDFEVEYSADDNWLGSLVGGMQDQGGLMYRRNRYYDPMSGQFTQPDPIGLAGGLNLYGYANGDPVNFSDPYGLSPDGGVLTGPAFALLGVGALTTFALLVDGKNLSDALGQGVEAGFEAAGTVVRSVRSRLRKLGEIGAIVIGGIFGETTPPKNDQIINPPAAEQVIPAPPGKSKPKDEDKGDGPNRSGG